MTINQRRLALRCKAHWQNTPSLFPNQILPKSLSARPAQKQGQENIAAKIRNENNEMKTASW